MDVSSTHIFPDHADAAMEETDKISKPALVKYNQNKKMVILIWLSVAIYIAFRILTRHVRSRRKYNLSLPVCEKISAEWLRTHRSFRKVTLRQSELVGTPLTYGILRPVILLPSEMQFCREDESWEFG